ncbi:ABC transporter permease [Rhodococcus ruber]|uniref:ABC transporter permease n=1 Tax=Rhodococcus ruber TaxID=1830 RepID=UPI00193309D9|nr:ABC transporter permease [Rhodococcus ruber]QRE80481.1 ABC transporter permease [Rhodococcus ruber]
MKTFAAMAWVEIKLFAREPLTVLFVLVLPVVILYVLNGAFSSQRADPTVWEGLRAIDFYTPSYVALVAATAGVLSLSVHLAGYREQGVLRRFRASAIAPATLVAAHMAVTAAIATAGVILLTAASILGYDAPFPRNPLGFAAAYTLVTAAFAALGALLGILMPTARAAQGLGVLLFFTFMMLGGAGPPREILPTTMGRLGDGIPLTYAARLLRGPWLDRGWDLGAAAVMAGFLVVSVAAIAWRLHAEDTR